MLGHGCARLMCILWPWAMIIGGNDGMQDKTDNPGMLAAEQSNYLKYYLRYLSALAMLELREHKTLRSHQGIDPSDDSERAQYRANCFRSSSARIATAMAKAQSCALLVLHFFL